MITVRIEDDGTIVEVLRDGSERPLMPEVNWARVDATTEDEIAAQIAEDDAEALRDAAAYARPARHKIGLSQVAFARRIGVPVDTVATGSKASARRKARPGAGGTLSGPTMASRDTFTALNGVAQPLL